MEDLVGDVVAPGAFTDSLKSGRKVRLLYQHDTTRPIGRITTLREDTRGLWMAAKLADTSDGRDVATLLRDGVLDDLSIGYTPTNGGIRYEQRNGKSVRVLTRLDLAEISLVTFPANELALVEAVKSRRMAAGASHARDLRIARGEEYRARVAYFLATGTKNWDAAVAEYCRAARRTIGLERQRIAQLRAAPVRSPSTGTAPPAGPLAAVPPCGGLVAPHSRSGGEAMAECPSCGAPMEEPDLRP